MPVATIFENLEAGANIDDILRWFDGLDREQVKAVIDSPPVVWKERRAFLKNHLGPDSRAARLERINER